jgi:PIN domain nuclease of toxin-antitoxin system
VIVLDTHVLLWFAEDHPRLGPTTIALTDAALRRDEVMVSAISFWEIAMLAARGRVQLDIPPAMLRQRALRQGIREVPLSGAIGIGAAELRRFHGDPADRMIVTTTLSLGAQLMTTDRRILRWEGRLRTHDARR